jgi:hypothetical protein
MLMKMPNAALTPDKKAFRRFNSYATIRRLSADPAMGDYIPAAPVNDEARRRNGNLPGMGGIFNLVNLHVYHYAGNNPMKYVDPDGRDIFNAVYDRRKNTITATYLAEIKPGYFAHTGRVYTWIVSNDVRNELNGLRQNPDQKTMPPSGANDSRWYFPRVFPKGIWSILKSIPKDSPEFGKVFIPTTAMQTVPTYGSINDPMPVADSHTKLTATGYQNDIGYGLHYSTYMTTLGCIRFNTQDDAFAFAGLSDKALSSPNGKSRLIVYE